MKRPVCTVHERKLSGSPHTVYSIVTLDGRIVHEQISPYGEAEIAERVAEFFAPKAEAPRRMVHYNSAPTGRPRRDPSKQRTSYDWNRDGDISND